MTTESFDSYCAAGITTSDGTGHRDRVVIPRLDYIWLPMTECLATGAYRSPGWARAVAVRIAEAVPTAMKAKISDSTADTAEISKLGRHLIGDQGLSERLAAIPCPMAVGRQASGLPGCCEGSCTEAGAAQVRSNS